MIQGKAGQIFSQLQKFDQKISKKDNPFLKWFFIILTALSPILVSYLFLLYKEVPLGDFHAAFFSDDIHYWTQMKNFAFHGFSSGYHSLDEKIPKASFIHFGMHGPGHAILYGSILSLFPWRDWGGIAVNTLLIFSALIVLLRALNLKLWSERIFTLIVFASFQPVILMLPTQMYESMHYAYAILYAYTIYTLSQKKASTLFTLAHGFMLFAFCAMRASWCLYTPIFFWFVFDRKKRGHWLKTLVSAGIFSVLAVRIYQYVASPFPIGLRFLDVVHLKDSFVKLFTYAYNNLRDVNLWGPGYNNATDKILWAQMILGMTLSLACTAHYFIRYWKSRSRPSVKVQESLISWGIYCFSFWVIIGGVSFAYFCVGSWFSRVVSVYFLFTVCLMLLRRDKIATAFIAAITIFHIATISKFDDAFSVVAGRGFDKTATAKINQMRNDIEKLVSYHPGQGPWCNTMLSLLPAPYQYVEFEAIPGGIGVGVTLFWQILKFPLQSRYVIFRDSEEYRKSNHLTVKEVDNETLHITYHHDATPYDKVDWDGLIRLKYLGKTPIGSVYLNLDARCPQ